jgi:hypothetical protein
VPGAGRVTKSIANPKDPNSLSSRFRAHRNVMLKDLLRRVSGGKSGPFRILDLGGRLEYWTAIGVPFLDEIDARIDCSNLHAEELSGSIETDRVRTIVGNGCAMDAADYSYDFVHSNSVIEHVGRFADMIAFAGEVRRLAPAYYVQTPYFWFPVDPHFYRLPAFHWMPAPMQVALLRRFRLGHSAPVKDIGVTTERVESRSILTLQQFRFLFPDGEHRFERLLGLPKSMIAVREQRS